MSQPPTIKSLWSTPSGQEMSCDITPDKGRFGPEYTLAYTIPDFETKLLVWWEKVIKMTLSTWTRSLTFFALRFFFVCYLLISTLSDVLQLSAKLDSSPISHHWKCAGSKKRTIQLKDLPPLVFKCASPRSNHYKFGQCHATGAILRYGVTLPVFGLWVVMKKFPQNTSITIVKNRENSSATMNMTRKSDEFIHLSIPTVSLTT